jgi:hypothetical protein
MTFIRVKAYDELYFEEAESQGYFYGTLNHYVDNKWHTFYVLVHLGKKVKRADKPSDDPNTKYKKFVNCIVQAAVDEKSLDEGRFKGKEAGVTVELFW